MGDWKMRSPDSFAPAISQAAIRSKSEDVAKAIPQTFDSLSSAKAYQKWIHYWRFCLRGSPTHPLHELETKNRITSLIKEEEPGVWRVYIHVKRQLYDYISHIA